MTVPAYSDKIEYLMYSLPPSLSFFFSKKGLIVTILQTEWGRKVKWLAVNLLWLHSQLSQER